MDVKKKHTFPERRKDEGSSGLIMWEAEVTLKWKKALGLYEFA